MWWPFKKAKLGTSGNWCKPIKVKIETDPRAYFNPDNYTLIGGTSSLIEETVKIKTRKFKNGYRMKELNYFKNTYDFIPY